MYNNVLKIYKRQDSASELHASFLYYAADARAFSKSMIVTKTSADMLLPSEPPVILNALLSFATVHY